MLVNIPESALDEEQERRCQAFWRGWYGYYDTLWAQLKREQPEPGCICTWMCDPACKGECGCEACRSAWAATGF